MTWEFVKSEPGADPVVVEGYVAAPPARVFQAWTDPDIVVKWFGYAPYSLHSAQIDLRPGGTWRFLKSSDAERSSGFEGEYLVIEPDTRLFFTWAQVVTYANGEREASPTSQVEVTFTAMGRGTQIRVVHEAAYSEAARRGFGGGWDGAFRTMCALFGDEDTPPSEAAHTN